MFAYIGCRTSRERNGRGSGLGVFHADTVAKSEWKKIQEVEGLINPSYLLVSKSGRELYIAHGDQSEVSSFVIDPQSGSVSKLNRQPTYGLNPVHLAFDPSGSFLLVANYATGSLAAVPIAMDGSLNPVSDLLFLPGEIGPHRTQQSFSHPHQILFAPNEKSFVVPDKGLDKIFTVTLDVFTGRFHLDPSKTSNARPGAGPRHAVFHSNGRFVYLVNELDVSLTTCLYEPEQQILSPINRVSVLPSEHFGESSAAGIIIDPTGSFLFVSIRGYNGIAMFALDPETGIPVLQGWASSQGTLPRFITLDNSSKYLLVANEGSDSIVRFSIDQSTGLLTDPHPVIETGSPTCIAFRTGHAAIS